MMDWVKQLAEFQASKTPVAIVTVTASKGSTPRDTGAKMLVLSDGKFTGTIGGGHLEQLAIQDALTCLKERQSKCLRYPLAAKTGQCCGGSVELLFEVLNVGPQLYLFGAGHVGTAITKTLSDTVFSVHLVDNRKEWIESEQIPDSVHRHFCEWNDFVDEATWDGQSTYAAVMTHRHDVDEAIIATLVRKPARYIGLIGSETKWRSFQNRLDLRGYTPEELARVKCPIGLPIGGKSPQEIAISFAAELLQFHYA